ncbi:MAG: Type II secretion system protein G precursor [Parcubacteria bacterium OLB19]|nr:MAG: Type II secretion system protein G precursor [Parcubacteria bacterium OLB19]
MKHLKYRNSLGFTLVELMVVISIIGIMSSILYVNYSDAREQARDKVRMTDLKSLQLAIETYKAQNGQYPAQGCGTGGPSGDFAGPGPGTGVFKSCDPYIVGLTPDFISVLPKDPRSESNIGQGFYYSSNGTSYKLMVYDSVERLFITSYSDEFARCPKTSTSCSGSNPTGANSKTYAVYSNGAADW